MKTAARVRLAARKETAMVPRVSCSSLTMLSALIMPLAARMPPKMAKNRAMTRARPVTPELVETIWMSWA